MKFFSSTLVLCCFLFSCKAKEIKPLQEYRDFSSMLIKNAGIPAFTQVNTIRGRDSVTTAVFVYEAEIKWQEIDKKNLYTILEKEGPNDLAAHWVRSTVWDGFCNENEHLEQIVKSGFSEKWLVGFMEGQQSYERFMIYKKNNKTFILYEVMD